MQNQFYKVAIISDTHRRLTQSAYDAVCGNIDVSQVYKENFLTQNANLQQQFQSNKVELLTAKPDQIIHCGDVGMQQIIDQLESVAPLTAVNGNCDFGDFVTFNGHTKDFAIIDIDGVCAAVTHIPEYFNRFLNRGFFGKKDPNMPDPELYIHGHTHLPECEAQGDGSWMLCPGSATQGRYGSPDSIAYLFIVQQKPIAFCLVEV